MDVFISFLFLKRSSFRILGADKQASASAFLWMLFAALFVTLGYVFFPLTQDAVVYHPDFFWLLGHFFKVFFVFGGLLFLSALSIRIFLKEDFSFPTYFRLVGSAHAVSLLVFYPPFSIFAFLWFLLLYGKILLSSLELKPFWLLCLLLPYAGALWVLVFSPAFSF